MISQIPDKKAFVSELLVRLKRRIEVTGESEKEFASRLGSSDALFKNLGGGSLPSADRLDVLLREIGETLVLGADLPRFKSETVSIVGSDYSHIPIHEASLSAGPGAVNDDASIIDHLVFRADWLGKIGVKAQNAVMARVTGESMAPGIHPGDLVLIDTSLTEVPVRKRSKGMSRPAHIYAFVQDGEARVKRIDRPDRRLLVLMSDNPSFPPELVTDDHQDSLTILGQVVWSGHTWR